MRGVMDWSSSLGRVLHRLAQRVDSGTDCLDDRLIEEANIEICLHVRT
jgi:hypothetical protein